MSGARRFFHAIAGAGRVDLLDAFLEDFLAEIPSAVIWTPNRGVTAPSGVSEWAAATHPTLAFEQATVGNRPAFLANQNDLGASLTTDGAKYMTLNAAGVAYFTASDAHSILAVCLFDGEAGVNVLYRRNNTSGGYVQYYNNGSAANDPATVGEFRTSGTKTSGDIIPSTPNSYKMRGHSSPRNAALSQFEGDAAGTTGDTNQNVAFPNTESMGLFATTSGTSGYNGAILLFVMAPVAITLAQRQAVKLLIDNYLESFGGTADV